MTDFYFTPWLSAIILLVILALVHATFQVGASVLTLLSGHCLGGRRSLRRLLYLNIAYVAGTIGMIILLLGAATYAILLTAGAEQYIWLLLVVWSCLTGFFVMTKYYRSGRGTMLWLPRSAAIYLTDRAKRTRNVFESMVLGGVSVLAELPITLVLIVGVSYICMKFIVPYDHLSIMALYALLVSLPLIAITVMLAGGHRLSTIQRWRENNKVFLQYAAALGLFAIALYIIVFFMTEGVAA